MLFTPKNVLTTLNGEEMSIYWFNTNQSHPPQEILIGEEGLSANRAYAIVRSNRGILWRGDYRNGVTLLNGIKRRARRQFSIEADSERSMRDHFQRHRLSMMQQAQMNHRFLVEITPEIQLDLPHSPKVDRAIKASLNLPNGATQPLILPLQALLGIIGAYEWQRKGVFIDALNSKIHLPYGIFSPNRGEYLTLIDNTPLPKGAVTAYDIGTGSGVLALLLAKKGLSSITGTDINRRAIEAARHNVEQHHLQHIITIVEADLFPDKGKAVDLILFNPPWLPIKGSNIIEQALYDDKYRLLKRFLTEAGRYLTTRGEIWLIFSNLAEQLELIPKGYLEELIKGYGYRIVNKHEILPTHKKVQDVEDPLHEARKREVTSLYQLQLVGD